MAAAIFPRRLAALTKLRCSIFQTSYNPTAIRTGAKFLSARLRGPSMLNYYPLEMTSSQFRKGKNNTNIEMEDFSELQRFLDVEVRRKRGKGTPKKAKTQRQCLHIVYCGRMLNSTFSEDSRRAGKRR